ncbi:MAG: HTTM domain-containing protein, partial [Bacteroidota bacterium]
MVTAIQKVHGYLHREVSIAPLIVFRIFFGGLLLYSTGRTWSKGWIEINYLEPTFHFPFISWLSPLGGQGMYIVYALLMVFAVGILLGLLYRLSVAGFLLLFTYVELLDKSFYLNHYYLVTLLVFWLLFVPANRWFSVDAVLFPTIRRDRCSNWHILIFKVQLSIVYFFAGLAKVNPDWLFKAQPLATWFPGLYELPILGRYLHLKEVAFLFSWAGCLYDLTIWIFLWIKKTRGLAYVGVLTFHIMTGILFPRIGMFPYIMIISTIIFFSTEWHEKLLRFLTKVVKWRKTTVVPPQPTVDRRSSRLITALIACYVLVQLYLPLRYLQYPGNLFWHERGYRFSWRVMLMEK